jgi:predicted TIM-barrel fold metal-dependent hydrolase
VVVDFHTHVFSPNVRENRERYAALDPWFSELYSSPQATLATAEDLISSMDDDGIEVSVILNGAWRSLDLCIETNDYILDCVARHPGRLVGFCMAPLDSGGARSGAAREIERCARGGARGIGEIRPDAASPELLAEAAAVVREHGLIVLAHASEPVGHAYVGKDRVTPGVLYPLITRYPDITLVCAHWGGGLPFYALMPEVRDAMTNVFFDTAASPFLYRPDVYAEVIGLVGADHVLFGSDYPLLRPRRLLKEIEEADVPPEDRRLIISGNAQRLLGTHAGSGAKEDRL